MHDDYITGNDIKRWEQDEECMRVVKEQAPQHCKNCNNLKVEIDLDEIMSYCGLTDMECPEKIADCILTKDVKKPAQCGNCPGLYVWVDEGVAGIECNNGLCVNQYYIMKQNKEGEYRNEIR